jgi:hypothetical protein
MTSTDSELPTIEAMTQKYHYLLQNGKGMRLYNKNRLLESLEVFEDAADNLPERISVNMNAAQALLFYMKATGKSQDLLSKARYYLDVSQKLDSTNDKYKKLESIYADIS